MGHDPEVQNHYFNIYFKGRRKKCRNMPEYMTVEGRLVGIDELSRLRVS